jgi:hypothetical protein
MIEPEIQIEIVKRAIKILKILSKKPNCSDNALEIRKTIDKTIYNVGGLCYLFSEIYSDMYPKEKINPNISFHLFNINFAIKHANGLDNKSSGSGYWWPPLSTKNKTAYFDRIRFCKWMLNELNKRMCENKIIKL